MIAVVGGTMIEKLHLENQVEEYIRKGKAMEVAQEELTVKDRMAFAWEHVLSTAKKVAPYVLVGVGIGAFIHNWIPEEFIVKLLGTGNPFGVVIAAIAGVPMYADIFGTIPIVSGNQMVPVWLFGVLPVNVWKHDLPDLLGCCRSKRSW